MKRLEIVMRINAIEPVARAKFAKLRDYLNRRLNDVSDPISDYEVDVAAIAKSGEDLVLYRSVNINGDLFCKGEEELGCDAINYNEFPNDKPPEEREFHSYLYHDLTDHSPQAKEYRQERVVDIHTIEMEVTIWEQFSQDGTDLQKAIQVARENLAAHAETRSILTAKVVEPEVTISAYMYEGDPDFRPDYADAPELIKAELHPDVEDPYEGVIKYHDLDSEGDMPDEIAARTELLYTDIKSFLVLSFPIDISGKAGAV